MAIELKVPEVGESITEVMIGVWKKKRWRLSICG
jgi:pyruvate/2-oxoglutarate dehydrogenase complex dihydrolipoamide acyltransferase (E2) component